VGWEGTTKVRQDDEECDGQRAANKELGDDKQYILKGIGRCKVAT